MNWAWVKMTASRAMDSDCNRRQVDMGRVRENPCNMDGLLPAEGRQGNGGRVGSPVSRIGLALGVTYESD